MESDDRLGQRIASYLMAVARLEDVCRQEENEFIRDSVIQRFEFCYEFAWKMLKLRLGQEGVEVATPRQTIQGAEVARFIDDGNLWTELLRIRNLTSHTYDEALANRVYRFVCGEGLGALVALADTAKTWNRGR